MKKIINKLRFIQIMCFMVIVYFTVVFLLKSCGGENKFEHQKDLTINILRASQRKDGVVVSLSLINKSKTGQFLFYTTSGEGGGNLYFEAKTEGNDSISFFGGNPFPSGKLYDPFFMVKPNETVLMKCFLSTADIIKVKFNLVSEFQKTYDKELGDLFIGDQLLKFIKLKAYYSNDVSTFLSLDKKNINMWAGKIESEWFDLMGCYVD